MGVIVWGEDRILPSIHRAVQHCQVVQCFKFCFHGDDTFVFYFLELFQLAVDPGSLQCCD